MTFVLFDVGANWGTDSLERTRLDPRVHTHAFEPTPELIRHLIHSSEAFRDRYSVHEIALSDYDGTAEFNVSAHGDWGISSLLTLNENLQETWRGRGDLYVDHKITVEVRRFDTWYEETKPPFERIDFFHCDTQGSDLAVLRGMGSYFGMIAEGVIECPQSEEVKLYRGQHSREEAEDFLSDQHYEVFRVEHQQNEDNLFFRRKT